MGRQKQRLMINRYRGGQRSFAYSKPLLENQFEWLF